MADRSVRVTLSANVAGFQAALARAQGQVTTLASSMAKASQTQAWRTLSTGLLAVGATLTTVSMGAVKMAADFEHAMSAVAATGAEAKANIGQLSDLALEMGAKTKYTSVEAAEGIEALAKAGLSTADILGGALAGALALAASDNMSLDEAAESTAMTLTQFGLAGTEAAHVADVMAAGAGKAVGSVHDISEALNNVGTVASQMGISLEETTGTLALFAQNGIVGAEAGTQLKSMLLKLMNPASSAQKAMDELGISVYDSNGKFIGLAGVADQLRDKLGGLTQEQRDQAMATIFGSRAVLGASILYKAGAEGVEEWTEAVNDAGFAQEMADEKMNNLQGDLEKLKSAFSNLAVSAGSAAQGPLRTLTQHLTSLVNTLGEHPRAAQAAVVAMGALGVAATGAGLAMKGITAAVEFRAAMQSLTGLSSAMETAKAAAGKLAAAGREVATAWSAVPGKTKLAAAGYMALMAAAVMVGSALSQSLVKTDEVNGAMKDLRDGSVSAADAIRRVSDAAGGAYLSIGGPSGLAQAMKDVADPGPLEGLTSFIAGLLHMKTTTQTAREHVKALDQSLAEMVSGAPAQAAKAMKELGGYIREAGLDADQTVEQFSSTAEALQAEAAAAGVAALSNQDLAMWMRTGIKPAAVEAGEAASGTAAANDKLAESASAAGMEAADYATTLSSLAEAMNEVAQAAIDASNAQIKVHQAMDDAREAVAENGAGLDLNTKAGRDNQQALNDLAEAALKAREAMVNHGDSLEEINETTRMARGAFVETAVAMGMEADDAEALAVAVGLADMTLQEYTEAQRQAAAAGEGTAQAVKGTADNFEYMGRKAGIAGERMYELRNANQESAAALDTAAQNALKNIEALKKQGKGSEEIAEATKAARAEIIAMAEVMGMERGEAEQLADMYGLMVMQLDMSEASVKNATTALENNAAAARLDTDRIRELAGKNQAGTVALQAYANKHRDATKAMQDGTMSAEEAAAAQNSAREAFLRTARQMGLNEEEAKRLADAYGLIPATVTTAVSAPGADRAIGQAREMRAATMSIPTSWHTRIGTSADLSGVWSVQAALNSLQDRTVTITTLRRTVDAGGGGSTLATGGYVTGPGTATSDSIPAWLSNGEYVIQAASVRRVGLPFLDALNAGRVSSDRLPRLAQGGPVAVDRSIRTAHWAAPALPAGTGGGQTVIQVSPAVITEGQLDRYLTRAVEQVAARVLTGALVQGA